MGDKKENINLQPDALYPAILAVTGDEAKRWCAAIWSTGPDERELVGKIQRLVESTLMAHWMQPPTQYEAKGQVVNSFDLVFFQSPTDDLKERLRGHGFKPVNHPILSPDEYEQFEVFSEKAREVGRPNIGRPKAVWRIPIAEASGSELSAPQRLGQAVANRLQGQVWGQTPGWFSRAFCEALREMTELRIEPTVEGLTRLEDAVLPGGREQIQWIDPMAYQALCDFVGVVLQADPSLDVQWGTCPPDEQTGLAPAPLLRARARGKSWRTLAVGRDVTRLAGVPWGAQEVQRRPITACFKSYRAQVVDGA